MQGYPIIINTSVLEEAPKNRKGELIYKRKGAMLIFLPLVFLAVYASNIVFLMANGAKPDFFDWIMVGMLLVYFVITLFTFLNSRLKVVFSDKGLFIRSGFKKQSFAWQEIAEISAFVPFSMRVQEDPFGLEPKKNQRRVSPMLYFRTEEGRLFSFPIIVPCFADYYECIRSHLIGEQYEGEYTTIDRYYAERHIDIRNKKTGGSFTPPDEDPFHL